METVLNGISTYTSSKQEAPTNEDPAERKPQREALPLPCVLSILFHTGTHC